MEALEIARRSLPVRRRSGKDPVFTVRGKFLGSVVMSGDPEPKTIDRWSSAWGRAFVVNALLETHECGHFLVHSSRLIFVRKGRGAPALYSDGSNLCGKTCAGFKFGNA